VSAAPVEDKVYAKLLENKQKGTVSQDYEHEGPQDYESEEPDVPAPPVEPKVSAAPVTDQPVTDQPVYKEPLATTILADAVAHLETVMESMSKRVDPVGPVGPVDPVDAVDPVDPVDRADPIVVPKASAEKRKADKKPAAGAGDGQEARGGAGDGHGVR